MKKIIVLFVVSAMFIAFIPSANAYTTNDLYAQLKALETQIKSLESSLSAAVIGATKIVVPTIVTPTTKVVSPLPGTTKIVPLTITAPNPATSKVVPQTTTIPIPGSSSECVTPTTKPTGDTPNNKCWEITYDANGGCTVSYYNDAGLMLWSGDGASFNLYSNANGPYSQGCYVFTTGSFYY